MEGPQREPEMLKPCTPIAQGRILSHKDRGLEPRKCGAVAAGMHEAELWHLAAPMYRRLLLPLGGPIYPEYLEARLMFSATSPSGWLLCIKSCLCISSYLLFSEAILRE